MDSGIDGVLSTDDFEEIPFSGIWPVGIVTSELGAESPESRPDALGLSFRSAADFDSAFDEQLAAWCSDEVASLGFNPGGRPLPVFEARSYSKGLLLGEVDVGG